jgi:type III restriction enzyme
MSDRFFSDPILNSPYEIPSLHWVLVEGIPTQTIAENRRRCELITPIPKPKKRGGKAEQKELVFKDDKGISTDRQQYDITELINSIRDLVGEWRTSREANWRVTAETARLLKHWRHHEFAGIRPFFCQVEAVETSIWLTEVAPRIGKRGSDILSKLERANDAANPGLFRIANIRPPGNPKKINRIVMWLTTLGHTSVRQASSVNSLPGSMGP